MGTVKKFKVGDYVETNWGSSGVKVGEQGIVIEASDQNSLQLIFPARQDLWAEGGILGGWCVMAEHLKLLYRPK